MINWLLDTFPLPEEYKDKSNWNTQINETTLFSPLATDAGNIAEGNKPSELLIFNEHIKVNTWQDVFIKFLNYLQVKPDFDFQSIIDNQVELFKRDNVILKWSELKEIIDNDTEISKRYKNFDSKVWQNLKEVNDDELFIHINISASMCMSRIATIIEKLFIPEDAVYIKLK